VALVPSFTNRVPDSLWMTNLCRAELAAARVATDVETGTLVTVGVRAEVLKETGTGVARSSVSVNGPIAVTLSVPLTRLRMSKSVADTACVAGKFDTATLPFSRFSIVGDQMFAI
jgi:hypothetical protein